MLKIGSFAFWIHKGRYGLIYLCIGKKKGRCTMSGYSTEETCTRCGGLTCVSISKHLEECYSSCLDCGQVFETRETQLPLEALNKEREEFMSTLPPLTQEELERRIKGEKWQLEPERKNLI